MERNITPSLHLVLIYSIAQCKIVLHTASALLTLTHKNRVSESEYLETAKIYPRLKTRLNNFHKQMDSTDKSDDDYSAIRPEWTTVDRILATRYGYNEQSYARLDLFTLYSCGNRRDVICWLIISCFCCY